MVPDVSESGLNLEMDEAIELSSDDDDDSVGLPPMAWLNGATQATVSPLQAITGGARYMSYPSPAPTPPEVAVDSEVAIKTERSVPASSPSLTSASRPGGAIRISRRARSKIRRSTFTPSKSLQSRVPIEVALARERQTDVEELLKQQKAEQDEARVKHYKAWRDSGSTLALEDFLAEHRKPPNPRAVGSRDTRLSGWAQIMGLRTTSAAGRPWLAHHGVREEKPKRKHRKR